MPDMTEIKVGFEALKAKLSTYAQRWRYYDGDQPLAYTAKRLEELFKGLNTRFSENWCAVVIDAMRERLVLNGLAAADEADTARLAELWEESQLAVEVDEAQTAALVCGEGFLLAWPDATTNMPEVYSNDPRLVHAVYESDNPRLMRYAVKGYIDDARKFRFIAYYPDRIETFSANTDYFPDSVNSLQLEGEERNPYGVIPVFHLRLSRRVDTTLGRTLSDLSSVMPLQDAINKLLADMMVSAEYGAFKQRYVISSAEVRGKLKNAPNEIWSLPAGDGEGQPTSVGEFSPTDLDNYLKAIEQLVAHISAITRTPRHLFIGQRGDISGEALIALEAPLVKKVLARQARFIPVFRQLGAFMLQLGSRTVDPRQITVRYADPSTVQPRTQAEITKIRTEAGLPLATALRREGWTDAELAEMDADRQAEGAEQQQTLSQALMRAQRGFDRQ